MSELVFDHFPLKTPSRTKEGYIIAPKARFARTGVQIYHNNGTTTRILKRPEVLFSKETKDSFRHGPITVGHPYADDFTINTFDSSKFTDVNSKNAKKVIVGMNAEVENDEKYLLTDIKITHEDGVHAVVSNKIRQLSAAYTSEYSWIKGWYEGEPYDAEVTKIIGNHIAIVPEGRAGPEVCMNFDSRPLHFFYSFFDSEDEPTTFNNNNLETIMNEQNSKLDEISRALEELKTAKREKMIDDNYKTYLEKIAELEKKINKINQEPETPEQKEVKEEEKVKEEKKTSINTNSPEFISLVNERVKRRMDILTRAGSLLDLENLGDKSDSELIEAVLASQNLNIDTSNIAPEVQKQIFDSVVNRIEDFYSPIKKQISKTKNVYTNANKDDEYTFDSRAILSSQYKKQ